MNEITVFLDVDGVLADFSRGAIKKFELPLEYEEISDWGTTIRTYCGMHGDQEETFWDSLDHSFWANLDKTPECDLIYALVEPYDPILLTSPYMSVSGASAGGKQSWIAQNFPAIFKRGRYLIGPCKDVVARPNSILIDDYDNNIIDWREKGGYAILVPRPWNSLRDKMDKAAQTIQVELIKYLGVRY